jgi:hypothetical protein
MWTDDFANNGTLNNGVEARNSRLEHVQRIQQSLWCLLAVIAVAEMLFGAWAVGLLNR